MTCHIEGDSDTSLVTDSTSDETGWDVILVMTVDQVTGVLVDKDRDVQAK